MSEPKITRIHVDYEDGSSDDIQHLSHDESSHYGLFRNRPDTEERNLGLHSSGAIAALLFVTALHGRRREYSSFDREIVKLLRTLSE
jgi:hypothetical protein